jgi:hypothetical protein
MAGTAIETVTRAVQGMARDLRGVPHALETVALGVITFAGEARLAVPLTALDMFQMPPLKISPGTSLGRALDLLSSCISNKSKGDYLMRFAREQEDGPYVAAAAHKLDGYDVAGGAKLPPVQSSRLAGVPPCPYCGNGGAAVCGCGGVMCMDARNPGSVVCPHCGTEQPDGFITGNFDVRQSAG